MENTATTVSPSSVGLRYGIMLGIVSIILTAVGLITGQEQNTVFSILGLVVLIAFIVLAHRAFKQAHGGFMSFGQGVTIGTIATVISTVLSSLFRYVYTTFIDPQATERAMEAARAKLEAQGMSDEQIDQAVALTSKMSNGPMAVVLAIVFGLFVGLILSLIISAITKRNRPEFE